MALPSRMLHGRSLDLGRVLVDAVDQDILLTMQVFRSPLVFSRSITPRMGPSPRSHQA